MTVPLEIRSHNDVSECHTNLTAYRGCVTPKQISNIEETIEGNLDFLDGYDEIDEDSQAKVRKALEDGHVADDEWKGVNAIIAVRCKLI